MTVNSGYKHLAWDSDFFGFPIGRVDLGAGSDLALAVRQARAENIRLLYLFAEPLDNAAQDEASKFGGNFVDCRTTYRRPVLKDEVLEIPASIQPISGNSPLKDYEDLAIEAGLYSRFRTDKGFPPGSYERLFTIWLRRSLSREIADEVYAIERDSRTIGLITLKQNSESAQIGLIAVGEDERGRMNGAELIKAGIYFCAQRRIATLDVVTQAQNERACRFYVKMGFSIFSRQYIYHLWL